MTTNDLNIKIAKWAGYYNAFSYSEEFKYPDFQHSDTEAIRLLPVLVEKGYRIVLQESEGLWQFTVKIPHMIAPIFLGESPTISEAICAAVEMVIDTEEGK